MHGNVLINRIFKAACIMTIAGRLPIPATSIDCIVYDFDGVMTDNRAIICSDGSEGVIVNRRDGLAIASMKKIGIPQIIISTEKNSVVKQRAAKLCIDAITDCNDKKTALINYCAYNHYNLNRVVYVGNDLNDLEAMSIVGFPVCPADAHPDILDISVFITGSKGGDGVAAELFKYIGK